jgi:hemin uptake protein HemP
VAVPPRDDEPETPEGTPAPGTRNIKVVDGRIESRDLFVGTREIIIRHRDESYRLRVTALNKLILTK